MPKTTVLQPNQTQFFSSKRLFISKIIVPITSTAVAVMFTFSFGSAFAMDADATSDSYFATYWAKYVKATAGDETVTLEGYAIDKTVVAGLEKEAKAAYNAWVEDDNTTTYMTNYNDFVSLLGGSLNGYTDSKEAKAFRLAAAAAQFAADKAEVIANLDTVPTYNYSKEVMSDADAAKAQTAADNKVVFVDENYTYQQAAAKLVTYFKSVVEDIASAIVNPTVAAYKNKSDEINNYIVTKIAPIGYNTGASGYVKTGIYDLSVAYNVTTNPNSILDVDMNINQWSAESIAAADKTNAAMVAAVKAQNAARYAHASVGASAAKLAYLDKWLKVADILAEEGYSYDNNAGSKMIVGPDFTTQAYASRAEAMTELEDYAAKYAAEKNAEGQLIRDAALVQKYLADGKVAIATCDVAKVAEALATAKTNIYNAVDKTIAAELAFAKESAKKAMELTVADAEEDKVFYAKELETAKGYVTTYSAKVDEAKDKAAVKRAYDEFVTKYKALNKAKDLAGTWKQNMTATSSTAEKTIYDAAKGYANYLDGTLEGGAKLNNDYAVVLKDRLADLIGESGARTNAEIKALKDEAVKVAAGLPSKDAVKAAKKALKAAVDALPAKGKIADLAAVQAVSDAIDAYADVTTTSPELGTYATVVGQIISDYNAQFAQQVAAVSETDEAAIKALKADISTAMDAIEDLSNYDESGKLTFMTTLKTKLNSYLDAIRETARKAVVAAIKAIPLNVTEADKATVVAARKLYDEYVAKYNDNTVFYYTDHTVAAHGGYDKECFVEGYAAKDIAVKTLTDAETVLGLNVDPAAEVKGLKITAKSTAKKGSITVKWTVKGDASAADGYQVWKSTKQSKGYKKAITTTKKSYKNTKGLKKGTRYYYKVRAYKVVDGKKVYSDWSNKAYRVAK